MVGYLRRFVRVVGLAVGVLGCGSVLLGVVSSPAVAATGTWSTPAITLSAAGGSANSPQISVNATGTAVAVWTRFDGSDYIVQSALSTDGGVTWSPSVSNLSAAGRSASNPQISVNAAGIAVAVWTRYDGSHYIVQSASSTDGGVTWSTPANDLSAAGGIALEPQISVNAAGIAVAVWKLIAGSNNIVQSASSTNGGVTWSPTVSNLSAAGGIAMNPQISVDAAGIAVAVWRGVDGSDYIVQSASSTNGGVTWSTTTKNLSAAGSSVTEPQISVNAAGIAVAVWTRFDGGTNIVQSASSTDGGVTWSTPANDLSAAGRNASEPQISVNAAGIAVAVWTRSDGSNNIVQTSSLTLPSLPDAGPSLPDTGITTGAATTTLGVGAGLLTAGALALVLLRRRLARR